jgi:large subunit ribosomal protein L30
MPAVKEQRARSQGGQIQADQIQVRQVRSAIGVKPKHRGTLRALGLGRVGQTNVLPDRPEIRGMVARVVHLVEVEEAGLTDGPQTDERVGK